MVETKVTRKHTFRKLEDLNLIDNFLFQQVMIHEDGEEFARILLTTILNKPIGKVKITPQKDVPGADINRHGICMDVYIEEMSAEIIPNVYDIEPNNTNEKETLPRRTRYYHGLIDTQLLSSGTDYSKLPNMFIIMILPYDPFGKDRMVYTIKNSCVEDPEINYNDGATKIYLYTKGKEGNPSQELKNVLKYIQESTKENAVGKEARKLQDFVEKVKQRREVGINYMKSWEMEAWIKKEAYKEGHEEGYEDGRAEGQKDMQEKINRLNLKLAELGRLEDLVEAARNKGYQEKLFKEFDL